MIQRLEGFRFRQATIDVQRPEVFQSHLAAAAVQLGGDDWIQRGLRTVAQQPQCRLANPPVGMRQLRQQRLTRQYPQIIMLFQLAVAPPQPVNTTSGRVNFAFVIPVVIDLLVIPVTDVHRAVRPDFDIDRPKPAIVTGDRTDHVARAKRRLIGRYFAFDDPSLQWFHAQQPTMIPRRQSPMIVNDKGVGKPRHRLMRHGREIAKRIRVGKRAVFLESLLQIRALLIVKSAGIAPVVTGKNAPLAVDFTAKSVAAALGEDFINPVFGMIAPDVLPLRKNRWPRLRFAVAPRDEDIGRNRAALRSVEPTVRPPAQGVGDTVGVFQPKTSQPHFGIAIRHVVLIGIRIKQQIRRIQHPDSAPPMLQRRNNIQSIQKGFMGIK